MKNAADTAAAGLALVDDPSSDVGVSGDLAWQSGTFKMADKSGAVVDTGKYITVFQRKNGKVDDHPRYLEFRRRSGCA